mgnify:CR=1 FL=1
MGLPEVLGWLRAGWRDTWQAGWVSLAYGMIFVVGGFAIGGVILYAGYNVMFVGKSPGEFFSVLTALLLAYEPAKRLARLNIELNSGLVGARMLLEIVDTPASEPDDSDKPALQLTTARVELHDVGFAYRADEPVLKHMSFVAEPGKVILSADYSQIELRILAHLADDPGLVEAFARGADIHTTCWVRCN